MFYKFLLKLVIYDTLCLKLLELTTWREISSKWIFSCQIGQQINKYLKKEPMFIWLINTWASSFETNL